MGFLVAILGTSPAVTGAFGAIGGYVGIAVFVGGIALIFLGLYGDPTKGFGPTEVTSAPLAWLSSSPARRPATVIRMYRGSQQANAVAAFQRESEELARLGYSPVSQSWAQGQWGCGAWLVALVLCVALIGLLIFVYMLIVKPQGTLTVTYTLSPAAAPPPLPTTDGTLDIRWATVRERLAQLDDLRTSGVVTEEEYAAKRAKIIDQL